MSPSSSSAPVTRPGRRFLLHVGIHCLLLLCYFLPGGLVWNRVEPILFGLPFGVLTTVFILPALIALNTIFYVAAHWDEDRRVSRKSWERIAPADEATDTPRAEAAGDRIP